jgi:hypothetical protein
MQTRVYIFPALSHYLFVSISLTLYVPLCFSFSPCINFFTIPLIIILFPRPRFDLSLCRAFLLSLSLSFSDLPFSGGISLYYTTAATLSTSVTTYIIFYYYYYYYYYYYHLTTDHSESIKNNEWPRASLGPAVAGCIICNTRSLRHPFHGIVSS